MILAVLMTIVSLIFSLECMNCLPNKNAWMLVAQSIVMSATFGVASFVVFTYRFGENNFDRWFNGLLPSDSGSAAVMILVGLTSQTVFGFLDNAGLFFGSN